jgi:hypothetical protein
MLPLLLKAWAVQLREVLEVSKGPASRSHSRRFAWQVDYLVPS